MGRLFTQTMKHTVDCFSCVQQTPKNKYNEVLILVGSLAKFVSAPVKLDDDSSFLLSIYRKTLLLNHLG